MKNAISCVRTKPEYPHECITIGLRQAGYNVINTLEQADLVCTWNFYGRVRRFVERHPDRDHVVFERAHLGHGYIMCTEKGFNGAELKRKKYTDTSRLKKLGVDIKPWNKDGKYILVCGQRGGNYSEMAMPRDWPDRAISKIKKHSDRPIIYRPHPHLCIYPKQKVEYMNSNGIFDDCLKDIYAVVVYTSSCATKAIIHGIPAFYCGPNIAIKECCSNDLANIENPRYTDNRMEELADMSWRQWTEEEIATGNPIKEIYS